MQVLVTGHKGLIGSEIERALCDQGHSVVGFDQVSGDDVRDLASLERAALGCGAVIHAAALLGQAGERAGEIMAVNLLGTWNVLSAAESARIERVVYFSSASVLGVFKGQAPPAYLPLDDVHPCRPTTPYGISKLLAEQMCKLFTHRTGITTICLRPPGVFDQGTYRAIRDARRADPQFEWTPYWEYGAFLDVRDVASAALCALERPVPRHAVRQGSRHTTLLLCAQDISSATKTSLELVQQIHPDVHWRGGEAYALEPFRALIDTTRAQEVLGWQPVYKWRD